MGRKKKPLAPGTVAVDNNELERELAAFQAQPPEDRRISERLGQICLDLCNNILLHQNWRGYNQSLKEDMRSDAILKIFKYGLKNFKFGKGFKAFSYLTRVVFTSYMTTVMAYYRRLNAQQELQKRALARVADEFPEYDKKAQGFRTSAESRDDGEED